MSDIQQRSDEWFQIRMGKVTASRVADVIAKTKTGYGATRANYMAELLAERLTGTPAEKFTNAAMQWGVDNESAARQKYSEIKGVVVTEIGFVPHPRIELSGASPDGLVGMVGNLEIKAPNTATHIETLLSGSVANKYNIQMQWQMACCERDWCDFVSYDPRLPDEMQLFIQRVERDDKLIAELEKEVQEFLKELDAKVNGLKEKFNRSQEAA